MEIVEVPSEILNTASTPVTDFAEIAEFARDLRKQMVESRGVGIAANQVGDHRAVCVVKDTTLVNPTIVSVSGEPEVKVEGCLSIPHKFYERPAHPLVVVEYQTVTGKKVKREFRGYEARIVQHEVRHLNGLLISEGKE